MIGLYKKVIKYHAKALAVIVLIITIYLFMGHKILNASVNIVIWIIMSRINHVSLVPVKIFNHYNLVHANINTVSMNKKIKEKSNYNQKGKMHIIY